MKKILIVILIFLIGLLAIISIDNNRTTLDEKPEVITNEGKSDKISSEDTEEKEHKITNATILSVGDIMFHMPQVNAAYVPDNQNYNFTSVFKYVKEYVNSADISIANFETVTFGNEIGFSGFPRFNSPVETLKAIKDTGFDILNTANNHALDQGKKGLVNTIDYIEQYKMKNIGTYKERDNNILIEKVNEINIAFLSYSYGFNGLKQLLTEDEQSYMISSIDEDRIREDIEKAKSLETDIIVVYIHWGNEYEREPSEYQRELGRKMVEWGANVVLGTHPHVIQETEIVDNDGKDNFIIYSMGNFLSNQSEKSMGNKYTEDGIMVNIEIEKDFSKEQTVIKDIVYIPTWVRRYRDKNEIKYEILPIEYFFEDENAYIELDNNEKVRVKESFNDTMEKMIQY